LAKSWKIGDRVKWRRPGERRWKNGNVRLILNDADGSVSLWDKRGLHVAVPNDPAYIKERKR